MKWMGKLHANGEVTDIKMYVGEESNDPELVELAGPPLAPASCYVLGGGNPPSLIAPNSTLSLEHETEEVDQIVVSGSPVVLEIVGPADTLVELEILGAVDVSVGSLTLDPAGRGQVTFNPTTLRGSARVGFRTPDYPSPTTWLTVILGD